MRLSTVNPYTNISAATAKAGINARFDREGTLLDLVRSDMKALSETDHSAVEDIHPLLLLPNGFGAPVSQTTLA